MMTPQDREAIGALVDELRDLSAADYAIAQQFDEKGDSAGNSFAFMKSGRVRLEAANALDTLLSSLTASAGVADECQCVCHSPALQLACNCADCDGEERLAGEPSPTDGKAQEPAWRPIETAPTDGTLILVYAAEREGLPGFVTVCRYHPDGGFCVDELRVPTHWMPLPKSPTIADLDTLLSSLTASTPKVDPLPAKYVDGVRVDSLGLPTELQSIELLLNDAEPVRPYAWKQAALRLRDATVEHVTELQAALDTERAMHAAWRKRAEEAEAAASAPAEAHGYLSRLLTSYAPQCEPLPDLLGVCTQIDNLMTGACMKPKGHEWGETRPRPPIVIESQDDAPSAPATDGKAQEP
jgi:hypothetical protein